MTTAGRDVLDPNLPRRKKSLHFSVESSNVHLGNMSPTSQCGRAGFLSESILHYWLAGRKQKPGKVKGGKNTIRCKTVEMK